MNLMQNPERTHADAYPTRLPQETWTERQDRTVWSQWRPDAPLTAQQADSFERNGFLVLENLFTPEEVKALQAEAKGLREGGRTLMEDTVITEPGSEAVRTIFKLPEQNALFDRLARDRRLAGIARFLLGDEVTIHQSRLNYKPGFTGKEFYWHSDFETWHAEDGMPRMRAVSASLLLTDNDANNGALMLMPGSHKMFVGCAGETPDDNHKTSLKAQEVGTPSHEALSRLARENGIETATGPAGTLVLFDCNTMHGSNSNITPLPRSNIFVVYNSVHNTLREPYCGLAPRPQFIANRSKHSALQPLADQRI